MSFPDLLDGALTGTLNHPPQGDESLSPERRLLRAASVSGLRWLAGRPLERPQDLSIVEPAAGETLPEIAPLAAARLRDIFERRPDALLEWLTLVRERGLRVPPLWLPELLETGRAGGMLHRELICDVGGARLIWLARMNVEWRFAAYADAEDQFFNGFRDERLVGLRRIRRRDPARGRELLRAAWRSERADARAALLATLEVGPCVADEDVLEDALRDPRRDVREVAQRLQAPPPPDLLGALRELVAKRDYNALATALREAPWRLDPSAAPLAIAWLEAEGVPLWLRPALERLVETLEYRQAMRWELDAT